MFERLMEKFAQFRYVYQSETSTMVMLLLYTTVNGGELRSERSVTSLSVSSAIVASVLSLAESLIVNSSHEIVSKADTHKLQVLSRTVVGHCVHLPYSWFVWTGLVCKHTTCITLV